MLGNRAGQQQPRIRSALRSLAALLQALDVPAAPAPVPPAVTHTTSQPVQSLHCSEGKAVKGSENGKADTGRPSALRGSDPRRTPPAARPETAKTLPFFSNTAFPCITAHGCPVVAVEGKPVAGRYTQHGQLKDVGCSAPCGLENAAALVCVSARTCVLPHSCDGQTSVTRASS